MTQLHHGQCGLCAHYGKNNGKDQQLIQIRLKHEALNNLIEECVHSSHAPLHLMVTPISGCADFQPASQPRQ